MLVLRARQAVAPTVDVGGMSADRCRGCDRVCQCSGIFLLLSEGGDRHTLSSQRSRARRAAAVSLAGLRIRRRKSAAESDGAERGGWAPVDAPAVVVR
jgi:hypothetical protein